MESVRTSIIGRPRPLSAQRHANQHYTLKCEEPVKQLNRFHALGCP